MSTQPVKRGRGRPRKDGTPNKATVERLNGDAQWEAQSLDQWLDEGRDYEREEEQLQQPIDFKPEPIINPFKLLKTGAQVLSKVEAEAIRPFLLSAVRGYSDELDNLITRTNRARTEAAIWSTLDDQEIATLVDGMLIIGQRQKHVALAVREVARTWTAVQAGLILMPRFIDTVRFYSDNGGIALW